MTCWLRYRHRSGRFVANPGPGRLMTSTLNLCTLSLCPESDRAKTGDRR
jgi:hypothetical protein